LDDAHVKSSCAIRESAMGSGPVVAPQNGPFPARAGSSWWSAAS
jgi:hypothetical protein